MKHKIAALVALLAVVLLTACSTENKELVIVPLGDKSALQRLADSWDDISEAKVNVSPSSLPGDKRRQFLDEVFAEAGFDYTETLHHMATKGIDIENKLHKDLAELILMPHRNQRGQPLAPADIYSMDELKDVAALERMFN